jgi:hypothetical protein
MTNMGLDAVGRFLSVLRNLPLWLLVSLAATAFAVLFLPAFGEADLTAFRKDWGPWAWIAAVALTIMTLARAADLAVSAVLASRRNDAVTRALRFVPINHRCWWHLSRQRDDSFVSQISLEVNVANVTDRPVCIIGVALFRPKPKGEIISAEVTLPSSENPYHSSQHPVPPHAAITASVHIMIRSVLGTQGRPLRVGILLQDQLGHEYHLKRIAISSSDAVPLPIPWKRRIENIWRQDGLFGKLVADGAPPTPPEWTHGGLYERVDIVFDEERRNYAACGRGRGGLGSMNVGLQSEPKGGWTTEGEVPQLLWDRDQAKRIESPTLETLLKIHASTAPTEKTGLETYLLSHLDRRSRYSDIGYFIFLALHRMGRTLDALRTARSDLSGDKVFGYSNLLGVMAGMISHEYFLMDAALLAETATILGTDADREFRLGQKINLARLRAIEAQTAAHPRSPAVE